MDPQPQPWPCTDPQQSHPGSSVQRLLQLWQPRGRDHSQCPAPSGCPPCGGRSRGSCNFSLFPRVKRRKMADKVLPQRIRELVPESQAYMDLLAFERKLDQTIARKRMEIQEAIKKPLTQKRKLRIYISNTFTPAKEEGEGGERVASWELRVEGKLLEDPSKQKRKFSSFFKSLVIELDKELYGPDNHLVEWHRMPTTQETDGFQVKRPGDVNVKCTLLLMLDHQPPQYRLDPRLARLLGVHTQTRASIMQALWLYIKHNKLQDSHEKEFINCNRYFRQIFNCVRMRFSEIPMKLAGLLQHPDPIIINHTISVDPNDQKKTACYDIDVEVDDPLKAQMSNFLASTTNQQEIASLDAKIHETIESINQLKTQRDFMLSFSNNPQDFIQEWIKSQRRDLKVTGNNCCGSLGWILGKVSSWEGFSSTGTAAQVESPSWEGFTAVHVALGDRVGAERGGGVGLRVQALLQP
uniref:SWI/SNF related BAF chromatin remodeling complex subunit D2 n=1 Tax=Ficedula albicollis TaxID=59894 RepID=A0A803VV89_FICAL